MVELLCIVCFLIKCGNITVCEWWSCNCFGVKSPSMCESDLASAFIHSLFLIMCALFAHWQGGNVQSTMCRGVVRSPAYNWQLYMQFRHNLYKLPVILCLYTRKWMTSTNIWTVRISPHFAHHFSNLYQLAHYMYFTLFHRYHHNKSPLIIIHYRLPIEYPIYWNSFQHVSTKWYPIWRDQWTVLWICTEHYNFGRLFENINFPLYVHDSSVVCPHCKLIIIHYYPHIVNICSCFHWELCNAFIRTICVCWLCFIWVVSNKFLLHNQ